MHRIVITTLLASLLVLSWASTADAQAGMSPESSRDGETTGGFLFAYRPHPGEEASFEEGYRRHLEWHRARADSLVWYGWSVLAGPRLGAFVDGTFGRPFAALDVRVDPAGDAADAAETFGPHATPIGREMVRLRVDLSTATPLEERAPTPFVQVVRYRAGPRDAVRLEAALADLRRARDSGALLPYTVYEGVVGEAPGLLLMIWRDGLKSFDAAARDPRQALHDRLADERSPGDSGRLSSGAALEVANELWRYRPDLTYLGREADSGGSDDSRAGSDGATGDR